MALAVDDIHRVHDDLSAWEVRLKPSPNQNLTIWPGHRGGTSETVMVFPESWRRSLPGEENGNRRGTERTQET
jgi:hypothetical protein